LTRRLVSRERCRCQLADILLAIEKRRCLLTGEAARCAPATSFLEVEKPA
jgi:hypothetical protein